MAKQKDAQWSFKKGSSINYVSTFEGGGGHKMLTDADTDADADGGGGYIINAYVSILRFLKKSIKN